MITSILEAEPVPEGVGFWLRALARLIDLAVHLLVTVVAGAIAVSSA